MVKKIQYIHVFHAITQNKIKLPHLFPVVLGQGVIFEVPYGVSTVTTQLGLHSDFFVFFFQKMNFVHL